MKRLKSWIAGHWHEVESRRARGDVGAEHRRVQAVGLDVDPGAHRQQPLAAAQGERGVGRAGEGEHVLGAEAVEQVAGAAADELQRVALQAGRSLVDRVTRGG